MLAAAAERAPTTLTASRFPLPGQLREVAESLLSAAKSGPPTRDTALTLLAADALMTLACEVVAEVHPGALEHIGALGG